jgi:hypothetical protein
VRWLSRVRSYVSRGLSFGVHYNGRGDTRSPVRSGVSLKTVTDCGLLKLVATLIEVPINPGIKSGTHCIRHANRSYTTMRFFHKVAYRRYGE